ncbi:VOC family protein [Candidatus Bathyarchaeota archaeon]|jgi:predicted enzyme related to lactoylglutathione lyase|nr:VOC family protein [Candidatus Bathyarchaeota archaeon]
MKLQPVSVAVVVSDKKRAADWYIEKLGLDILMNQGHVVVVGRKEGGLQLHLCQHDESGPEGKLEPGNSGILFFTDKGMTEACGELANRGVKLTQPPKKDEFGWNCRFTDPDGNEFTLMSSED